MAENNLKDFSGIEFVDDQERQYLAEAQLGHDTIKFLRSPVGRLLHGRAKQEYEQAKEELLEINPDSRKGRKAFKKIQERIQHARWFIRWCADVIENGDIAIVQLEEYRSQS